MIASTYSLLTKEFVVNPDLSLYPEGTVTVPVPCGERTILLLPAEVESVEPFKVKSSTTTEVRPAMSVVVEPLVNVLLPNVIVFVSTCPLVTVKFAVANEATPLLAVVASSPVIVIVLSVTDVSIPSPPVNVKVSPVLIVSFVPLSAESVNVDTTVANSKLPLGAKTPPEQMPTGWQSTGRNEICPCGSGKKFKHCHGRL